MVYLFPFFSYLDGAKSISHHPPDRDSMTFTAQETTASLSGKNKMQKNEITDLRKHAKYVKALSNIDSFLWAAFETLKNEHGSIPVLVTDSLTSLVTVGRRPLYLFQRISMMIQRFNLVPLDDSFVCFFGRTGSIVTICFYTLNKVIATMTTTAHIVFDLRSLIWVFGKSCMIVKGMNAEPENVLSNVLHWHFRRSPTIWLQFERETFWHTILGVMEDMGVWDRPIQ